MDIVKNLTPTELYKIIFNKKRNEREREKKESMIQTYLSHFKKSNKIQVNQFQKLLTDLYDFMGDYLMPLIPKEDLVKIPKEKYIFIKNIANIVLLFLIAQLCSIYAVDKILHSLAKLPSIVSIRIIHSFHIIGDNLG